MFQKPREANIQKDGVIHLLEVTVLSCSVESDSLATPWTVAHQVPLSMRFSRQEYWIRLPFPSPGDLPNPGVKPMTPALADGFFTTEPPEKPTTKQSYVQNHV